MVPLCEKYYASLSADAGPDNTSIWETQIKYAETERQTDVSKMDVMASRVPQSTPTGPEGSGTGSKVDPPGWIELAVQIEAQQ